VLTDASDYSVTVNSALGTINPALLTVTAVAVTKTYDGTSAADGTPLITAGQLFGTDSGVFTESFGTVHAGTGLTLTPTGTITDGNGGADYTVTYVPVTTGVIDPRPVIVTGTRVYDGGTDASSSILTITNVLSGDTVDVAGGTGVVASRNVGNETLTSFGTLTLGGASAGDYTVVGGSGAVTITPEPITVTAVGGSKVYDGTTAGPGTPIVTAGTVFGPDSGEFTESYGSPNAGSGIVLTPTGTVADGNGGGNYTITFVPVPAGTITPRPVDLTGTRPFDGLPDAPGNILTVVNNIDGGNLTISGTGTLISPAVGNEPIIAFGSLTLGGSAAGNYTFVGGSGNVLVTPTPNYWSRRDQTVAGVGLDPYVDVSSTGGYLLPEPGQNGLTTCLAENFYVDGDGVQRPLCHLRPDQTRGIIIGAISQFDMSAYPSKVATQDNYPPLDTAQMRRDLYRRLRNK
jgi:hypothetical protein